MIWELTHVTVVDRQLSTSRAGAQRPGYPFLVQCMNEPWRKDGTEDARGNLLLGLDARLWRQTVFTAKLGLACIPSLCWGRQICSSQGDSPERGQSRLTISESLRYRPPSHTDIWDYREQWLWRGRLEELMKLTRPLCSDRGKATTPVLFFWAASRTQCLTAQQWKETAKEPSA